MATTSNADGLDSVCPWCLEVAGPDHARRCTALDLQLRLLASSEPPADPDLATQVEWFLWGQEEEHDELPPSF